MGSMKLKGNQCVNYCVIRVNEDRFVHYSGKGMREIFGRDIEEKKGRSVELLDLDEPVLIELGYIAITLFSEIEAVLS
jgi:hypothetical protein